MKKLLTLTLALASFGFAGSSEAKAAEASANAVAANAPQQIVIRTGQPNRRYRRWDNRNRRRTVTTQSRLVRVGRRLYRETYRVVYRPNGTIRTQLISRVRVR